MGQTRGSQVVDEPEGRQQKPKGYEGYDEFKDFRLQPHEFLMLACNAFNRTHNMSNLFKPNFNTNKREIRKMVQYELTESDLRGDFRPNVMLDQRLEEKFFDHIPDSIQGRALSNRDAGLEFAIDQRQLVHNDNNKSLNLRANNLKYSVLNARNASCEVAEQWKDLKVKIYKKRQEAFRARKTDTNRFGTKRITKAAKDLIV